MSPIDLEQVQRAVSLLMSSGEYHELRILTEEGPRPFIRNTPTDIVALAAEWSGKASGVYLTLNPIPPTAGSASDGIVLRRRWFAVDFDPVRPAGMSSTEAEKAVALDRAKRARDFLASQGWPEPVLADSGNGSHLLYACDLPNDAHVSKMVKDCLRALRRFEDDAVSVDQTVSNASRIWKLYGTLAMKGTATPERPHRIARILEDPGAPVPVLREQFESLAALAPKEPDRETGADVPDGWRSPKLDLVAVFKAHEMYISPKGPGVHKVVCPWHDEHSSKTGDTESVIFEPGPEYKKWGFKCQHDHCEHRTVREVVKRLKPSETLGPDDHAQRGRSVGRAKKAIPVGRSVMDLDSKPIDCLVDGLIPEGMFGLLSGQDSMGKTLFAMEIAKSVLRGEKLFGEFPTKQGTVAAVFLDDPEHLTRQRLEALGLAADTGLRIYTQNDFLDTPDPRDVAATIEAIAVRDRPSLLIVDALYRFIPSGGTGDQGNSSSAMAPVLAAFNRIAETARITVMLLAHDNRSGMDVAGSYVVRAEAKYILRLALPPGARESRDGEDRLTSERVLELNKLKIAAKTSWRLRLDGPGQWVLHGTQQDVRHSELCDAVLLYLEEAGTKLGPDEIASGLHRRAHDVRRACLDLWRRDRLKREDVASDRGQTRMLYSLQSAAVETPDRKVVRAV